VGNFVHAVMLKILKLLPGRQDLVQGQKNADLQEPVSINLDGDPEESYDITLACFLRKKSKKR
jgi:hypothetical protein